MNPTITWALLILFAVHTVGAIVLGLRRREIYYVALILTFALLCASLALSLFAPELSAAGLPLFRLARYLAWGSAFISISWSLLRLRRRLRSEPNSDSAKPPTHD